MRKSVMVLAALGSFALVAGGSTPSAAMGVVMGSHSGNEVLDACNKVGGTFYSEEAGYGCTNDNCDGKGGTCKVACNRNDHSCIGSVPGRVTGGTGLSGILKGTMGGSGGTLQQ